MSCPAVRKCPLSSFLEACHCAFTANLTRSPTLTFASCIMYWRRVLTTQTLAQHPAQAVPRCVNTPLHTGASQIAPTHPTPFSQTQTLIPSYFAQGTYNPNNSSNSISACLGCAAVRETFPYSRSLPSSATLAQSPTPTPHHSFTPACLRRALTAARALEYVALWDSGVLRALPLATLVQQGLLAVRRGLQAPQLV